MNGILKIIMILSINKVFLKLSAVFGIIATFFWKNIEQNIPSVVLGTTIFLWVLYVLTVFLDWKTGILASKYEAKKMDEEFVFDREKASVSWYKHALFIIIIATIHHFQEEAVRLAMPEMLINTLSVTRFGFFAYNMLTEWYSIELNKKRINDGKESRFLRLIEYLLTSMDSGIKSKMDNLTGNNKNK